MRFVVCGPEVVIIYYVLPRLRDYIPWNPYSSPWNPMKSPWIPMKSIEIPWSPYEVPVDHHEESPLKFDPFSLRQIRGASCSSCGWCSSVRATSLATCIADFYGDYPDEITIFSAGDSGIPLKIWWFLWGMLWDFMIFMEFWLCYGHDIKWNLSLGISDFT